MKRFTITVFVALVIALVTFMPIAEAQKRTVQPAMYNGTGLYYDAFIEAIRDVPDYQIGKAGSDLTILVDSLTANPGQGGFVLKQYYATGEADGVGGFDIDTDIPAGGIVISAQVRADTAITATTGVSWTAAFKTGSSATIASGLAFTQNTKSNAFFDANGATAILSDVTDVAITPNAGSLDTGFVTAYVTVLEHNALDDAIALTYSTETFSEHTDNDGTIDNSTPITVTAYNKTFYGTVGSDFVTSGQVAVENVPAGLTLVATKTSSTVVSLTLTGTAAAHATANDVSDLTITFNATAFDGQIITGIVNRANANLIIDFEDPA